jgi:hypothetical protein
MNNFKEYIRKNSTLAEIVVMLTGIILVVCGTFSPVLTGIGTSIIASAVVIFMTDVLIGKEENDSVRQWGLETVYKTRGEMNSSSDYYLSKAKYVDFIAFGLKSWRDSQQDQIEKILANGGKIRIITMKPGCCALKARERDEHAGKDEISHSIELLIEWAKRENEKNLKGKIEIRYHDHLPLDFMHLMDNRLFTGPYEYGKDSQQTLSFEYNNAGAAYEYYKNYFNKLWNDSGFCFDALN